MNKNRGFTLIELLVSMSLLSMIVLLGASAFSLFGDRWNGRLGNFDSTMRNAQNIMLVQDVLNSLIPYVVYDDKGKPIIYFEGNRNGFVAVSSKSIYSHGDFAVVRFSVVQNPNLTFNVLYEEWPMGIDMLVSISQPLNFSPPLVLFENVKEPTFRYFGWGDFMERSSDIDVRPAYWADSYNGVKALFAPLRAKFTFTTDRGVYRIFSTLTSQKKGLLSRYKIRSKTQSGQEGLLSEEEDCVC